VGLGSYSADVEVTRPGTVMLKATYHPNWHARVDGREVATEMLMPSYVGVPITPGSHHVEMSYEPQPPRHVLMVVGLLTLIAVGVAERRRDWLAVMVGRGSTALAARPVWAWEPALRRLAAWLEGASAGPRLGAHAPYLGG